MKIVIADDNQLDLKFLENFLQKKNHIILFKAANGKELLDFLLNEDFDFAVADMYMPIMNGIEIIEAIKKVKPESKFIIVSINHSKHIIDFTLQFPNVAYVIKYKENYLEQIEDIISGESIPKENNTITKKLTDKEALVLRHLITPKSTSEICEELNLSQKNLERFKTNIYAKLNVKNRTSLLAIFANK
jgi:DNA-binding NarL/FixJ family response regulator